MRRYLPDDGNGSRILLTSRLKDVAPPDSIIHALPFLSDYQCWDLLQQKLFQKQNFPQELVEIGKQIATHCQGLPLAVVAIAAVLANKENRKSLWDEVEGKDRDISVRKLISLWIAEGFIQKDQKSLREVAEEYLVDLIDRSLVLISKGRSEGGVKACGIHDLLRELCLRKANEENFLNLIKKTCQQKKDLDLTGIEQLVRLRYLAVRVTKDCIPPSIGRLQNLEFLLFEGPGSIEIPEVLLNLVKLRHLHVKNHATFSESCHRRAIVEKDFRMNCLESISNIWIIHEDDEQFLRCSPHLGRLKCGTRPLWDSSEKCRRYLVLDYLTMLESLNIFYLGSEFKFSGTINFPTSLQKLTLHEFKLFWKEMSMIGRLPKLEVLKLLYAVFDGKQWKTNDDEFQELKFLKLDALKIQRWNTSSDHFPKLQRLVMQKCWKLKKVPSSLGDIPTLQIIDIHSCSKSVANSALQIQREQLEMGNEELKVIISGSRTSFIDKLQTGNPRWQIKIVLPILDFAMAVIICMKIGSWNGCNWSEQMNPF
ncbi:hypothetical protein Pfo_019112 [Paulownia fortunei]|nr:hypothetical protein Pfo_019112 [Paulownia fortunei]